jgi:hypothetical protein
MHDVNAVIGELSESGNFVRHVKDLLASCPIEVLTLVKQSVFQAVEPLKELLPGIMDVMIGVIVKRSNEVSGPMPTEGQHYQHTYILLWHAILQYVEANVAFVNIIFQCSTKTMFLCSLIATNFFSGLIVGSETLKGNYSHI